MALNWNDLVQIQEKVREQAERRREIVDEARQNQVAPIPEPQDTFTNLVQTESEEPQPEPQNTPTVEEQKKEETPTVEPITEPVETKQEQEPVVQPVTQQPKTDRQEETKQPEVVQANDTETLYNDWESYLAEQDRANAVIDTGTTTQPVDETPLVTPVTSAYYQPSISDFDEQTALQELATPNGLPEGAMDWTPEQWAEWQSNPVNRQAAVEAANRQAEQARQDKQIEDALNFMQTDLGIPIYGEPTADDIAYAQQLLADNVVPLTSDAFASTLETPVQTSEQNNEPTVTQDVNEPVSYQNDWRTLIDQWENAEAANNELYRESLLNPVSQPPTTPENNGYVPVSDLRDYPNIQGESNTESEQKPYLYNEQYLKDLDLGLVDDSFTPEELAELYGGTVESTTWDGTTGTPRTSGYERAERDFIEKPRTVYDAIADLVNNSGIDPDIDKERLVDIFIEDNNLEDTPVLRGYLERMIDYKNSLEEEPTPVTGNDVKNTLSDMFNTAKDVVSTVYTLNNPGQAIMNEVVKGASDFVNNTLQPGTDRIQIAEQAAIDAGYLPGTPEFDTTVDNILKGMSDKKSRLDEFNEQLLEQPRQERYYRGLENLSRNAMAVEDQRLANYPEKVNETYNNLLRAGWDPETAKMLALNNDLFGLYDKQGNYIGAKNPEQVYEAPAYNADGTPNATLQAILNGEYEIDGLKGSDLTQADYMPGGALHEDYATQILHSFDVNGGFWENGSVVIPKEIIDLMATDPSNAFGELFQTGFDANLDLTPVGRNAGNVQYANVTDEQWMAGVEAFIKANPALEKLITDGILTQDDIASHFFKAPISAKASGSKPKGSGSGYGYGRYGGGGGGGGYGGGGGGYSRGNNGSAPSAKSQTEQRINNIMKNWTF